MITNPIDGQPYTGACVDRILGLADQFLEDWEAGRIGSPRKRNIKTEPDLECVERRKEYDALRPMLVAAPRLLQLLEAIVQNAQCAGCVIQDQPCNRHLVSSSLIHEAAALIKELKL